MKMIKQMGILFGICWVSIVIEKLLPFSFPASVIGMVLLFVCLFLRIVKVGQIRELSDFLLGNMAFFFVPAGVGMIEYYDVLGSVLGKLLIVCVLSTIVTFGVTAWTVRIVTALMGRRTRGNRGEDGE